MLVVVGRAAGKEGEVSGTGEHLDKRHVLLAPPQPVLGVRVRVRVRVLGC